MISFLSLVATRFGQWIIIALAIVAGLLTLHRTQMKLNDTRAQLREREEWIRIQRDASAAIRHKRERDEKITGLDDHALDERLRQQRDFFNSRD